MRDELNKLADRVETIATDWRYSDEEERRNAIAADLRALAERCGSGSPIAWIRFCSDGLCEGPIHDSQIDDIRRKSGVWTPLFPPPPPAATIQRIEQCCVCGKRFDARELSEGGGPFGSELSDGRWVCSTDCWDAVAAKNVVSIPGGWRIEVTGEHLRVTKPDGRESEWHSRPGTNGSGMYDLCVALVGASTADAPKCGRCSAGTGDSCDERGCGYLNSGNGLPKALQAGDVSRNTWITEAVTERLARLASSSRHQGAGGANG